MSVNSSVHQQNH